MVAGDIHGLYMHGAATSFVSLRSLMSFRMACMRQSLIKALLTPLDDAQLCRTLAQSSFRIGFGSVCRHAIQSERIKEVVLHVFADIVGKNGHPFMQPVHNGMYTNAFLQYREELR